MNRMINVQLGDAPFYKALALFINKHKFTAPNVFDLAAAFDASGSQIGRGFLTWTNQQTLPVIRCALVSRCCSRSDRLRTAAG